MTRNITKRLAASTVLAGCAVLVSTPAYGAVAPEPEPPSAAGQPSQGVIDHYLADTTSATSAGHQSRTFPTAAEQPSKAMVEHAERSAAADSSVPGVLSAQTKAQVEHLEAMAAQQEAAAATAPATGSTSDDDGVSAPLVVLALLGGGLITGAATTYTLRRVRHNGPISTATA